MVSAVVVDYTASGAQFVAKSFVDQYYNVLLYVPAYAYKFYVDSSVVSWPGSDGKSVVTVTTMEKIQELIMSQNYHGFQAVVETIDGQASQSGGIVVVVKGTWRGNETARSFSQTFLLERKGKKPFYWNETCHHCSGDWHLGSYYIVNDIFRFVDHHEPPPPPPPSAAAVVVVSKAAAAVAETRPSQQQVVSKAETLPEKSSHATIAEKKAAAANSYSWADQVDAAHKVVVLAATSKPKNDNNCGSSSSSLSPQDDDVVLLNSKSVALNNNNNNKAEEKDREARTIYVGNLPLWSLNL